MQPQNGQYNHIKIRKCLIGYHLKSQWGCSMTSEISCLFHYLKIMQYINIISKSYIFQFYYRCKWEFKCHVLRVVSDVWFHHIGSIHVKWVTQTRPNLAALTLQLLLLFYNYGSIVLMVVFLSQVGQLSSTPSQVLYARVSSNEDWIKWNFVFLQANPPATFCPWNTSRCFMIIFHFLSLSLSLLDVWQTFRLFLWSCANGNSKLSRWEMRLPKQCLICWFIRLILMISRL